MNAPVSAVPATKKGEETRERILAAATDLIHARGFKETGLSDILAASGVPKGSFYHYFPSKEDLGRELLVRYRHEARAFLEREAFPPTGEVVPQFVRFFEESARQRGDGPCRPAAPSTTPAGAGTCGDPAAASGDYDAVARTVTRGDHQAARHVLGGRDAAGIARSARQSQRLDGDPLVPATQPRRCGRVSPRRPRVRTARGTAG